MRFSRILTVPLVATLLFGCSRQLPLSPNANNPDAIAPYDLSELHRIARQPLADGGAKVVAVPAGSADALAAALVAAGPNGTVLLKSGVHTESGTVEISTVPDSVCTPLFSSTVPFGPAATRAAASASAEPAGTATTLAPPSASGWRAMRCSSERSYGAIASGLFAFGDNGSWRLQPKSSVATSGTVRMREKRMVASGAGVRGRGGRNAPERGAAPWRGIDTSAGACVTLSAQDVPRPRSRSSTIGGGRTRQDLTARRTVPVRVGPFASGHLTQLGEPLPACNDLHARSLRHATCTHHGVPVDTHLSVIRRCPMRRLIPLLFALALGLSLAQPALAARRVVVVHHGPHRTTVHVYHGWPLARPARIVVERPVALAVRVQPRVYLRPIVWAPATVAVVASHPSADALAWTDGATLVKEEDWTEVTLNCGRRGTRLWYEVTGGKVQADWAEVVFLNGQTQVVDFAEHTQQPGLYPLLDFREGRIVDHVRLVARSKTDDARVALRLEN